MSNKIHDAFAGLHMDPARAAKIEHALRQAQAAPGYTAVPFRESRRSRLFTLSAAACLLAVILLGFALLPRITAPAQELAATDPEIPTEELTFIQKLARFFRSIVDAIKNFFIGLIGKLG